MQGGQGCHRRGEGGITVSKHTPGPWVVIDRTKEDYEPRFSVGWQAGMKGGMLERCVCWCLSCFGPGAETRANAYLIAAAPEMLETLEDAAEILDEFGMAGFLERSEALAAKARGE